jgi:hypothetical protein
MLEEPPHEKFNVTQTYALFTTVVCWVVQRIRVKSNESKNENDRLAAKVFDELSVQSIDEKPWAIQLSVLSWKTAYFFRSRGGEHALVLTVFNDRDLTHVACLARGSATKTSNPLSVIEITR